MKKQNLFFAFLVCACLGHAQSWSLKITSHIGFRKYNLDTKAVKDETLLAGASIKLYKGNVLVDQTTTDIQGYFSIFVPSDGEFEMMVTSSGCFTKKIHINTNGVPSEVQKSNMKQSLSIEGFVLSKPLPGIDYSTLNKTLAKIVYIPKDKNFGDEELYTQEGLAIVNRIEAAEMMLINRFCDINKAGDEAMLRQECILAKKLYDSAMVMLPAEQYPAEQMKMVKKCFREREEIAKKAEEVAAAKALEEKYADALKKGDEAFKGRNWNMAREAYTEALSAKANEQYPIYKISAVEKLVYEETELKNNLAKATEIKAKYETALKLADDLFAKKLWSDAEDAYYEALSFMPDEKYLKTQIVATNKMISREHPGDDRKYKDAIARAIQLEPEYVYQIKKNYEDALTYENDASYLKKKSTETASLKNKEHVKAMLEKYPQGLTEEIINGNGVVIVKRVLIKDGDVWVYQKKIFNWGGVACFRDDLNITESIFENETKI